MCTKNGKAGLIGEHSMADGMPMIDLADYLTKNSYSDVKFKSSSNSRLSSSHNGVENIFKNCTNALVSGDSKVESMVMKGMVVRSLDLFNLLSSLMCSNMNTILKLFTSP